MIQWVSWLLDRTRPAKRTTPARSPAASLGIQTLNPDLYRQALRHVSATSECPGPDAGSYDRLEYLGDAVLDCVVADHLFRMFPGENEGFLTSLRSKLVSRPACARVARTLDLGAMVTMSQELENQNGRNRESILADCLEAVIGAIYLDKGMRAARRFVHAQVLKDVDLDRLAAREDNFKSRLLEYAQAQGWEQPVYEVLKQSGVAHRLKFTVGVQLAGQARGIGHGSSKKKAEQQAARAALGQLSAESR